MLPRFLCFDHAQCDRAAIVLIKDSKLQTGTQLAIAVAKQSQESRIDRYLERIYNVQEYLDKEEDYSARKQREIRRRASLCEAPGQDNKEISFAWKRSRRWMNQA